MSRLLIIICIIITGLMPTASINLSFAQGMDSEYTLKSVFLERFCRFIQWPPDTGFSNETFVIGVIGDSPFNPTLDTVYAKQTVKGKRVEVRYFKTMDGISNCHLLFIAKTDKETLRQIINNTKKYPILTVSDTAGYGRCGVHINMYIKNKQVQFEINNAALQRSDLTVSSLLLNVAKLVETSGEDN